MTRSLRRLRQQIVRAKMLAEEASFIAEELNKRTEYVVTLQIPAANLDANRKVTPAFIRDVETTSWSDGRLYQNKMIRIKVNICSFLGAFH